MNVYLFGGKMGCFKSFLTVFLGLFLVVTVQANPSFPIGPDANLTPGSLCDHPDSLRYRERIPYCERDVDTRLKNEIFQDYIHKLGFRIDMRKRYLYKIDHLIPLCAGGSNHRDNLWPQHESIYKKTDILESTVCEKMSEGRLTQRAAVDMILKAKKDLSKVTEVLAELRRL